MTRVVVTGMGTLNPIGNSVAESWESAVNGVSGVGPISLFDASDLLVRIAAEVKHFNPAEHMEAREARRQDRFEQLAAAASQEAVEQSGLQIGPDNAARVAVIISSATGGIGSLEHGIMDMIAEGPRRVTPFLIPMYMSNGAAGLVAIHFGAKGPAFSVASACASGADGIGQAWGLIRAGVVDSALAGASDASISKIGVSGFDRLGAMSRRNDDYSMTPAPFDKDRDGLVMGEGAAVLILESLEHAKARGAEILAELVGYCSTSDAFHITAPADDGAGGSAAIAGALQMAGVNA